MRFALVSPIRADTSSADVASPHISLCLPNCPYIATLDKSCFFQCSGEVEIMPQIMQNNLQELNAQLAAYERISGIALYPNEFEKTPKRSIKRYLYEPSLLNK